MVVIRLARGGAKKQPFYHVVATDSRNSRDSGRSIERLGYYNPVARGQATRIELNVERIDHWIKQGAKPSERVQRLLKDFAKGETAAKPRRKHSPAPAPKAEAKAEEKAEEAAAPAEEAKADDSDKAAE